jgi:hypothetical protein
MPPTVLKNMVFRAIFDNVPQLLPSVVEPVKEPF